MATNHSKVLWLEGMALDPHHFQQWDRYQAHQLHFRMRTLARNSWGLLVLEIDEDRLRNGEFVVIEIEGVLADGFAFDLPSDGPLPASRAVSDAFDPGMERLDVYFCIPTPRSGANLQTGAESGSHLARFRSDSLTVSDENTGRDERSLEVAQPSFQLRFGNEQLEGFSRLQVASVVRSAGGFFALDERFIPASLQVGASKRLSAVASKALELCIAKSGSLDERRLATASQRQLTPADITAIGLLAAVNGHIPLIKSQIAGAGCHPEEVYNTLLSLAGQLSAYSSDASFHPREFPVYDHSGLTSCFNRVSELLAGALGGAQPSRHYRQVPLKPIRENLFEASVSDEEISNADFILSAKSADVPESRLTMELPNMLRIASPEVIDGVLQAYTRALVVQHTSRLPVGMPEDPLASYFRLERSGPFWDGICESNKLAVFIPAEFSNVELKLAVVLRG